MLLDSMSSFVISRTEQATRIIEMSSMYVQLPQLGKSTNERTSAIFYSLGHNSPTRVLISAYHAQLTSPLIIYRIRIRGNNPCRDSILIGPPIIPQLALPRPEDPTHLLLIRDNLRGKPLPIKRLLRARIPAARPLHVVRHAERKFADDGWPVAAAVVVAGG